MRDFTSGTGARASWPIRRLRFLARINPPRSEVRGLPPTTEVSFVPMDAVGEYGGLRLEETRPIDSVYGGYTYFRDGDVLVAKITPCFENGKGAICAELEHGIGFGTTELHVLRPVDGVDKRFLFYLTISQPFRDAGTASMIGAAGQKRVPEDFIRDYQVAVPPLDEQRAIAGFLDEKTAAIDALIAKKERLIELIEERLRATITRAVTKGLDSSVPTKYSGVEWLGDVPVNWVMKRLKHVVSHVTSGSRGWAEFYSETGAVFLRIGNLRRGSIRLDLSDVQRVSPPLSAEGERTRIQQGDVLFSITAFIGSVAVVHEDLGVAYVNQHIALVRPKWGLVDPSWIGYSFLSEPGQRSLKYPVYGGTKEGLGLDDIRNLPLPCPPLDEQRTIVQMLEAETGRHHELVEKARHQIDRLREYRQTLISAAVTGQIDIRKEIEVPA